MKYHSLLLEPDAASAHHHREVKEGDEELHGDIAPVEERDGRLEDGEDGGDDIDPKQLSAEGDEEGPHGTQQH